MNPQSLRIGNYVKYENGIYQMSVISKEGEPGLDTIEFGYGVVTWKGLKPVPLTEDLLIKFRFKNNTFESTTNEVVYDLIIDDLTILSLTQTIDNNIFEWQIGKDIEWTVRKEIKYVHTLQNLLHSLTGKELVINKTIKA